MESNTAFAVTDTEYIKDRKPILDQLNPDVKEVLFYLKIIFYIMTLSSREQYHNNRDLRFVFVLLGSCQTS